jgi:hypothetical protein
MDQFARADRRIRETTVAKLGKVGGAVPAVAGIVVGLPAEGPASNDWELITQPSESLVIIGSRAPAMAEWVVELLTSRLVYLAKFVCVETIRTLAEVGCSTPRAGKQVVELLKSFPDDLGGHYWDYKISGAILHTLADVGAGVSVLAETAIDVNLKFPETQHRSITPPCATT